MEVKVGKGRSDIFWGVSTAVSEEAGVWLIAAGIKSTVEHEERKSTRVKSNLVLRINDLIPVILIHFLRLSLVILSPSITQGKLREGSLLWEWRSSLSLRAIQNSEIERKS